MNNVKLRLPAKLAQLNVDYPGLDFYRRLYGI